jgi:predicted nucleic acid-binding protein
VHEFLAIVTHPRVFNPPTPLEDALRTVEGWARASTLRFISEAEGYGALLAGVLRAARVTGPRVHDARIAALCIQDGVDELWTADRDFSRFATLRTRNPLVRQRGR